MKGILDKKNDTYLQRGEIGMTKTIIKGAILTLVLAISTVGVAFAAPAKTVAVKDYVQQLTNNGYKVTVTNSSTALTYDNASNIAVEGLKTVKYLALNDTLTNKLKADIKKGKKGTDKVAPGELKALVSKVENFAKARAKEVSSFTNGKAGYVGPESCATCHPKDYQTWRTTSHTYKLQRGPAAGDLARKDRVYSWVQAKWNDLETNMILDVKTSNKEIYVTVDKYKLEQVDLVIGELDKQRYMVYYNGEPRKAYIATSADNGISWTIDKSKEVEFAGNKDRAGYKFLFIEVKPDGTSNKSNYGEFRSYQERCINCHTTGFDPDAWEQAKTDFKAGKRADLKDLFINDLRVTCEACHGPGLKHVTAKTKADRIANIVNPKKITDPEQGLMVCGQCHTRTSKNLKYPGASDLRGYNPSLTDHEYTNYAEWVKPAWGKGNREASIDGKARRLEQEDMDIRLSRYLNPMGKHGYDRCYDCHATHSVGNNKTPEKQGFMKTEKPNDLCVKCHGSKMDYKVALDGTKGWGTTKPSFGNWGGSYAIKTNHIFNFDINGNAFGLAPEQYTWKLIGVDKSAESSWEAIWPWLLEKEKAKGNTTAIGAKPWLN